MSSSEQTDTLSAAETRAWLGQLRRARPELFERAARQGCVRGIDVVPAAALEDMARLALSLFRTFHGRLPDLVGLPDHTDYMFALKFFGDIPMPNPADKLNSALYVPEQLRDAVLLPKRPYVSEEAVLPPDEAVPPGRYFLKSALGSAQQVRLTWPTRPELRPKLEARIGRWLRERYGLAWGEWWYAYGKPRWFFEEDLSDTIAQHPEWRIFVRRGRVRMGIMIHYWDEDIAKNSQRIFDADLRPLPGRSKGRKPLDKPIPPRAARFVEIAAAIGERFDIVRVDFLDNGGPRPILGELTLCDANTRRVFDPPEFNRTATELLFSDP